LSARHTCRRIPRYLSGDVAQQTDKKSGKMWNCSFPGLWERTFSVSTSLEFKFSTYPVGCGSHSCRISSFSLGWSGWSRLFCKNRLGDWACRQGIVFFLRCYGANPKNHTSISPRVQHSYSPSKTTGDVSVYDAGKCRNPGGGLKRQLLPDILHRGGIESS